MLCPQVGDGTSDFTPSPEESRQFVLAHSTYCWFTKPSQSKCSAHRSVTAPQTSRHPLRNHDNLCWRIARTADLQNHHNLIALPTGRWRHLRLHAIPWGITTICASRLPSVCDTNTDGPVCRWLHRPDAWDAGHPAVLQWGCRWA